MDVWRLDKPEFDARSDGSARTVDEAFDLEALACMATTDSPCVNQLDDDKYDKSGCNSAHVSGLPLVCSNCGVSFFSLKISDDQLDCYCSGECKWSVIMYREMNQRMFALRQPVRHCSLLDSTHTSVTYYEHSDKEQYHNFAFSCVSDEATACSTCG